ncbi:MAG: hypothetical protein ABL908_23275 [Hyphomicrobium sp.]
MKKDTFNERSFSSARDEINKRIELHHKLLFEKYALAGAVLAFLLDKGRDLGVSPFLLASLMGLFMDIVIIENLGWIRAAGHYIRTHIESSPLGIVRWENDFAQRNGNWTCFTVAGYVIGTLALAPALIFTHFALDPPRTRPDPPLFIPAVHYIDHSRGTAGSVSANTVLLASNLIMLMYALHLLREKLARDLPEPRDNSRSPLVR